MMNFTLKYSKNYNFLGYFSCFGLSHQNDVLRFVRNA